ncbi:MAG TPA: ectoine synthase [Candidatus Dormibacteraeota bacterium]|nr:ectoine synthase [Candidatus Dormibacteraeota bacterium]
MIIRSIGEIEGTERDVRGDGWRSRRLLRKDDGMSFSFHWTELSAGSELHLEYTNHVEGNLCVGGEGEVVDLATNEVHPLRPGVMYALDKHDRHLVRAHTDLQLVCVFWPALTGTERHTATGGYEASPAD